MVSCYLDGGEGQRRGWAYDKSFATVSNMVVSKPTPQMFLLLQSVFQSQEQACMLFCESLKIAMVEVRSNGGQRMYHEVLRSRRAYPKL